MAITLNGSTGVTTPSIVADTDTLYVDATNNRVGVGTTSPSQPLEVNGQAKISQGLRITASTSDLYSVDSSLSNYATNNGVYLNGNAAGWLSLRGDGTGTNRIQLNGASYGEANIQTFFTSNTERMRIDSSGRVLVNLTSLPTSSAKLNVSFNNNSGSYGLNIYHTSSTYSDSAIVFYGHSNQTMGYIYGNGTSTQYGTSSDYRLKENIAPMTGALAKVSALKPVTYTWKSTGEASQGFIAHELQEVVPDAVYGEKDAVNEDGSIKAQGIDTSFLVATLTAAIQEQQAIITELKTRIEALEQA